MKRAVLVPATLLAMVLLSGQALAGPEWCDAGSPPPNDWRLRQTGAPSEVSSLSWLKSTTSGTLDLSRGTNTLQGGVAVGMQHALANAAPWSWVEQRSGGNGVGRRDDRP